MKINTKIEKKYIPKNGKAVLNLHVHFMQDINIKAGQYISICPTDLESIEILDIIPSEPDPNNR